MIEGSCPLHRFDHYIYTVLKHSHMVSDVLEQHYLVVTSDAAIFILAKTNSNQVSRRFFKHRALFWRITHHSELPVFAG